MNLKTGKSRSATVSLWLTATAALAMLVGAGLLLSADSSARAAGKKLDTEWGYDIKALRSRGLKAPVYLQKDGRGLLVSDLSGGVFSVTMRGKVRKVGAKDKIRRPGGVARAPKGFGLYGGQVFVLVPEGKKDAPCVVKRIDKSGGVSLFAKLPKAGSLGGGQPTQCRDLQFGPSSGPFAGKLYAATNGNAAIYEIDASGKARTLGVYEKPVAFELTAIYFAPSRDRKAANKMLVGMRPRMGGGARIGQINLIGPDGKMAARPYLVGFVRPTGFGYAPRGFGSYGGVFFIADAGQLASENKGARDGKVLRVYKGVARPYSSGLVDPTCLKFVGNRMVLCDPAEKGKVGRGAIVIISSIL